MGLSKIVAVKVATYMGASKQVSKTASKKFGAELAQVVSGKSRGEKKAFYKAIKSLASETGNQEEASSVIFKTITKGKLGTGTVEEFDKAAGLANSLTLPLIFKRSTNRMSAELPEIIGKSMQKSLDKSFAKLNTPEFTSKMVKEVQKEYYQSLAILGAKTVFYPINKLRALSIPKGLRKLYGDMVKLPSHIFPNKYYENLLTQKGLLGRAPSKVVVTNRSAGLSTQSLFGGVSCEGGFSPLKNTIEYTKEFTKFPKSLQADLLTHELKHFEQFDQVIRTVGIEKYAQALKKFGNVDIADLKKVFAGSINSPKINPNSPEGKQALKYLEAIKEYKGIKRSGPLGIVSEASDEYLKNLLEVEAYSTGHKAGKTIGILDNLNLQL